MKFESSFGEALMLVWFGTAVGLVLGTAALATLFPDVPYGVEIVIWGATLPAPILMTYWIYRHAPQDGGTPPRKTGRDGHER